MRAMTRAMKAKAQKERGSMAAASAEAFTEIEAQLRALIKAKLGGNPSLREDSHKLIGRETVEELLDRRRSIGVEHLTAFADLFGTTPALLLAEARGDGTLLAKVALHEQLIPVLKLLQGKVEEWRSGITPSPREDEMLEGNEEMDEATELRALLECLGRQHLADTIAAAQQMANWYLKGKK